MCVLSFSKVPFMNLGALAFGQRCSELRLSLGGLVVEVCFMYAPNSGSCLGI